MGLARAAAARTLAALTLTDLTLTDLTLTDRAERPDLQVEQQGAQPGEQHAAPLAAPQRMPSAEPPGTQSTAPQANGEPAPPANPARSGLAGRPSTAAPHKPTDPAVLFTRLAAVVRDCIALEARLAAGTTSTTRAPMRPADPRRTKLQEALRLVTTNHPDRAALLRETTARADEHLAADPDQTIEIPDLLIDICEELGIEINLKTLPDEFLFTSHDPLDYNDDFDDNAAPDPRATSPP